MNDTAERNLLSGDLFAGVWITGQGTSNNAVAGNWIGTDISGSVALNNGTQPVTDSLGNIFGGGVVISAGASGNRIGTDGNSVDDVGERNVIGGSGEDGVDIYGTGTDGNVVAGNFIGTDVTGTVSLGIFNDGVLLAEGASSNWIGVNPLGGTATSDEGNVIPGNDNDGVQLVSGSDGNTIAGNKIGTDVSGTVTLPDPTYYIFNYGVEVDTTCVGNTIGGLASGAGNVISGNWTGILVNGADNLIEGNKIGTDITGTLALGNMYWGVVLQEAADNTVGGSTDGAGNLISGNDEGGVAIRGIQSVGDVVQGNLIGTDVTGTKALGNGYSGVYVGDWGVAGDAASNATIGGTTAGAGNVISANGNWGIWISGAGTTGVVVQHNLIGTDLTGTAALGNAYSGVQIDSGAANNTIGGTTAGSGNLIANNQGPGVTVAGDGSLGNQITANRIFANSGQAIDFGNDSVTYNSTAPRQGPNNLQNFPIIFTGPDGQLQGGLWGSLPDTTFRIDFYASSSYGPGGAGEAEDYLGPLTVTTDNNGQAIFDVPDTPPAGLPIVTATATDPQGNTSEVSAQRRARLNTPSPNLRIVPNESLVFSSASGNGFSIQDPDAGPFDPTWNLSLSVSAGTLTLSNTAGLTGSGDGTGSLSYSGTLQAVDAALGGMTYNPPAGLQVFANLQIGAQSDGAPALETQLLITDRVFVVSTTADSGPGSLRQAILDSNTVTGATNTIDFDIAGSGVRTIVPLSLLPPITASVLIDGTTQPGFNATPLIALASQSPESSGPLVISAANVTIRGLALGGVTIDATADERLIAVVAAQGAASQLSLLDAEGHVLVQNDGVSSDNPDHVIDEDLAAGDYSLALDSRGGQGASTWTSMLTPADSPSLPIPVGGYADAIVAGDFTGDGYLDLAVANVGGTVSVLLGNGDGTFQPQVTYAVGQLPHAIVAGDFTGDGRTDLAVANYQDNTVSVLLGNGDGTFQPQVTYAVGAAPDAMVAGDFTGDGRTDLAVANYQDETVSVLLGNGDGTFQPQVTYAVGSFPDAIVAGDFTGAGRTDLAVANYLGNTVSVLLGNGDGTFQPQVT